MRRGSLLALAHSPPRDGARVRARTSSRRMHVHARTWAMARAAWRVRRAMGVPAKPSPRRRRLAAPVGGRSCGAPPRQGSPRGRGSLGGGRLAGSPGGGRLGAGPAVRMDARPREESRDAARRRGGMRRAGGRAGRVQRRACEAAPWRAVGRHPPHPPVRASRRRLGARRMPSLRCPALGALP